MVEIDGSYCSGGGQILRTACALAVVTKKPCRVFNIRKSRPKPGLATQHLLGIQALAQLCSGALEGDELGSEEIKFFPGETYRDRVSVKIPTAGSITLVLQTLIPPALFAPRPIEISFEGGATDTFFSPTIDHFRYVFLKILEKMGGKLEIEILKRGYYPEGGAKINVKIFPSKLREINLTERGELKKIAVLSGASEFLRGKKVAERQTRGVREVFGKLKLPIEEKVEYEQTQSPGSQICLIAEFKNTVIGADNLGKLGERAEDVGKEAALELLKEEKSHACLDKRLADQILPYMALAPKKSLVSVSEITNHCKTNIWVIEKFVAGKFKINPHTNFGVGVKGNLIGWAPKI
ncbi:MAG: RNA 3'-phosphate cyclase [Candidatus Nealsonbacteria bacterium CG08_land_8_20_14_0_20_38_20]|uniref:RNA 3'-terminal phosphate cyclase n=1 Tax=Candidatus Nealsonbacteria bacterium CG08_land_8_20_14_0_20_38_20 TaxID=1974705 RepID=A0A2H0YM30_9BACT|nr:MAG: RNA 3'-phosphate cyclase [Candidatus Nealsonbacteria bacterium CG08_land_8_20_14_0_20_38_20]